MATRIVKPTRDDSILSGFESTPEVAPSSIRKEGTLAAQIFLFIGFFLVFVGSIALIAPLLQWSYAFRPGLGYVSLTIGVALMLYHCLADPEPQFKILYSFLAIGMIAAALFIRFIGWTSGNDGYFLGLGIPLLFGALFFAAGVLHKSAETSLSNLLRMLLLGVASLFLTYGTVRGYFNADFITGEGILVLVVGLAYVSVFLMLGSESDQLRHLVALALGAYGAVNVVAVVLRSLSNADFFVPSGLIFLGVGLASLTVSLLLACDWAPVVLARRELGAFFYSPVAYLVLFGILVVFGVHFLLFAFSVRAVQQSVPEPIVYYYVYSYFLVVAMMVIVPFITMQLVADEKKSGSLEVLLTAPVSEWAIVVGKFSSALISFLVAWVPFFLFMVAFRVFGDAEFDFRPLLGFLFALIVTGAGLIAMGLFFSSLTSSAIVAAVLTFAAMIVQLFLGWMPEMFPGTLTELVGSYSYFEVWKQAARGLVALRFYVFYLSYAVFFLFLTNVVLTSRKWK